MLWDRDGPGFSIMQLGDHGTLHMSVAVVETGIVSVKVGKPLPFVTSRWH